MSIKICFDRVSVAPHNGLKARSELRDRLANYRAITHSLVPHLHDALLKLLECSKWLSSAILINLLLDSVPEMVIKWISVWRLGWSLT